MTSWNTHSVQKYLHLVATARSHNSKEVRMTIQEAQALCDSISFLLLQERELTQQLLHMQERMINSQQTNLTQDVSLNGGKF